jgi:hypothetical protein
MNPQMVMYEEEFNQITAVCERLTKDANAKVVFLVDKNGQLIAATGQTRDLDTTSLASLTAGNIAATGGLAKLIGEKDFSTQFHEATRTASTSTSSPAGSSSSSSSRTRTGSAWCACGRARPATSSPRSSRGS